MPTPAEVQSLRERTGVGVMDCARALEVCDGDHLLAEGYLKYVACAVYIRPKDGETEAEARKNWVMMMAREWKQKLLERKLPCERVPSRILKLTKSQNLEGRDA